MKLIEKPKEALGGSGGMLTRKIFENLRAVMAILVNLNNFGMIFRQILFNVLTLFLSPSPNMMHFVRTFSIMRA